MSLSILFEHLGLVAHFMSAVAQHVVVQGVRFSSQGDLDCGLVGQGALHGRAQDRHHQHISLIVSSKGAIWGDDSEDLRFIVLHGELR